jgi:hypothetical protein
MYTLGKFSDIEKATVDDIETVATRYRRRNLHASVLKSRLEKLPDILTVDFTGYASSGPLVPLGWDGRPHQGSETQAPRKTRVANLDPRPMRSRIRVSPFTKTGSFLGPRRGPFPLPKFFMSAAASADNRGRNSYAAPGIEPIILGRNNPDAR